MLEKIAISIFAAVWGIIIYSVVQIYHVDQICLKAGSPDAKAEWTDTTSYCIDKYKSIVVPLNEVR